MANDDTKYMSLLGLLWELESRVLTESDVLCWSMPQSAPQMTNGL
jgi:hypothetical protein